MTERERWGERMARERGRGGGRMAIVEVREEN